MNWNRIGLTSFLALMTIAGTATPGKAAEVLAIRYGLFVESFPVADLHRFAETQEKPSSLKDLFRYLSPEGQRSLRQYLQIKVALNRVALDRVLNGPTGIRLLTKLAEAIEGVDPVGVQALRSAAILGTKSDGVSVLSFLDAYPTQRLTLNLTKALRVMEELSPKPPDDTLSSNLFWQTMVQYQGTVGQGKHYPVCLFGDSISSALGSSLEPKIYNFAIGGMSSISLIEQLKYLKTHSVTCQKAVIAIGTNDAWYTIPDDRFVQNMKEAIALTRQLGAQEIVLLPAFYSTLEASHKPKLAGSLARVEAINQHIQTLALSEGVSVETSIIQPLFAGQTLKAALTTDGVHLNEDGLTLYRNSLLQHLNL
jgi:lysophospholipase L1-like esterase